MSKIVRNFAPQFGRDYFSVADMVDVAQLVRATDCGSVGRGFEPHLPPVVERGKGMSIYGMPFYFTS